MFDIDTGYLRLGRVVLAPTLTRSKLEGSVSDFVVERYDNHCRYSLSPSAIGAREFRVLLYFSEENLIMTQLSIIMDGDTTDWNQWSMEREKVRKEQHDMWLMDEIGRPPYRYPWGVITSTYDPRSGTSHITINYT